MKDINKIQLIINTTKCMLFDKYNTYKICNIASSYIYYLLDYYQIDSKVVFGMYINNNKRYFHCWNKLDDIIVDITNSQFDDNLPNIIESSDVLYNNYNEGVVFNIPHSDIDDVLLQEIKKELVKEIDN